MGLEDVEVQSKDEGLQEMSQAGEAREPDYVLTLEEIGNLAAEGGKPAETLMNVVALIARRFKTDVCSAYLLEPDRANLVLAATVGLSAVYWHPSHGIARRSCGHGGGAGASGGGGRRSEPSSLQVFQRGR